jgi:ATP-binding cassette, subfamily B, bacterial
MKSNALARLWPFVRPHRRGLIFSLVVGLGMMAAGLAIPPLIGAAFDAIRAGREGDLVRLAGLIVVVGAVEAVFAFARRYSAAVASVSMERDMRNGLYQHLQRLPVSFHDEWQSGQLLSRAMGDLSTIRRFIGFGLIFLMINVVQFVTIAYLMVRLHAWLALFTALMGIPIVLITLRFDRQYHAISRRVQDDQGDLTTIVEESATGIRILKAFGRGRFVSEKFRAQADVLHTSNMHATMVRARLWSLLRLLPNLNLAAVVALGGYAVIGGTLSIGGLATFVTYFLMLTWPIRSIGWILAMGEEALTGAERFFEVLDTDVTIQDRAGALPLERPAGHVRFEGVSFRYPGSSEDVLRNVNLEIRPGETLALVGETGCGKTTLASLVPRLYDATEGRVTIDGVDVRDMTLDSLRSHIGVAFEEPILFSMSARENLLLGRPDASEEEIRRALETAEATFIDDLPWGLDTRVGEQGYTLSGGQRQRLALARAVLEAPQVLVLDDPLSSIDVHTEAQIEEALASVMRGVTALLVVHRPSTLALADRVALLHEGTVVAVGTHHELMETVPLYRSILSQEAEEVAS